MNPSSVWKFDKSVCSRAEDAVCIVRDLVGRLDEFGWTGKDVFGIHMAMEEALMNAIKHGNAADCEKKVHIEISVSEESFYSRITDEGAGFQLDEVPDPTADENLEKTSGRGVMLIKNFVDRVEYNDKGNSVELFKSKTQQPSKPDA